jgi:hypothetical protein
MVTRATINRKSSCVIFVCVLPPVETIQVLIVLLPPKISEIERQHMYLYLTDWAD